MKKNIVTNLIFALAVVLLGVLIALAPYSFAHVCVVGEKIMKCYWTARVELFLGTAIAVLGLIKLACTDVKFQHGLNVGIAVNAIGVILIPTVLIGVCKMASMHCNVVSRPTLTVFGILVLVSVVIQTVLIWKKR